MISKQIATALGVKGKGGRADLIEQITKTRSKKHKYVQVCTIRAPEITACLFIMGIRQMENPIDKLLMQR